MPGLLRARAFDVIAAGLLLAASVPLIVLAALAIRIDSPGPVLFRQTRVGRGGRLFEMLKLRTMAAGADGAMHQAHVRQLIPARAPAEPWRRIDPDPRVTRVGRILRRTGIDELPQLVNVLRGEMRLVGPRPALPYEVELWQAWHFERLAVPPGITGLWQVAGRDRTSFDDMVRLDLAYIAGRSLGADLAILARTPAVLLRRARAATLAPRAPVTGPDGA